MMRKLCKIFIVVLCTFIFISNVSAKSLKQVKEELARDEANRASLIQRQKNVQSNIKNAKGDISDLENQIEKYENEIDETLKKIDELNDDIDAKQKEIDNLLAFMQKAKADNVYLEYIF